MSAEGQMANLPVEDVITLSGSAIELHGVNRALLNHQL